MDLDIMRASIVFDKDSHVLLTSLMDLTCAHVYALYGILHVASLACVQLVTAES